MKNVIQIFLILVFPVCNSLYAQVAPLIEWQKFLGGSNDDAAYSIQQTTDHGFIVAGASASNDGNVTGHHTCLDSLYYLECPDYWILKLDSNGNLLWQKSIGGSSIEWASSIQQTFDGGYIVAGSSASNDGDISGNHGDQDYWIVKLDSIGNIEWQKCFGGSYDDEASSIQQISDGGYIVAGYSLSNDSDVSGNHNTSCPDYWIVRLDFTGNLVWQKCLGGSGCDQSQSIQQTSDGGFIVAGLSNSNDYDVSGNHGGQDYWVVKLDTDGNIVWEKSFGGTNDEWAYSVQQISNGGFIVAGFSDSNDGDVSGNHSNNTDYWIVRLDATGNIVWQKCFGGSEGEVAYSIQQTFDSGFIVTGYSYSNDGDVSGNHGYGDDWIVKLDTGGSLTWQECLGFGDNDQAYCIQQTFDSGFIVAGLSYSNSFDYWIVKLSDDSTTGINSMRNNPISLFPNPVQSQLTINLATSANEVTVHVYDVQGKMISPPTSNFQSQTSNSLQLNTKNLPSGFYTLQIINNKTGESQVGKFVKTD